MPYVTFIPRHIAEIWVPDDRTLMISINHPDDEQLPFSDWNDVLWLFFDDVTQAINGYTPFDLDMADRINRFVSEGYDVVIHCQAGMSRSAAVAKWVSEEYGHELIFNENGIQTLKHHNQLVYNTLNAVVGKDMASYYQSLEQNAFMNGDEL